MIGGRTAVALRVPAPRPERQSTTWHRHGSRAALSVVPHPARERLIMARNLRAPHQWPGIRLQPHASAFRSPPSQSGRSGGVQLPLVGRRPSVSAALPRDRLNGSPRRPSADRRAPSGQKTHLSIALFRTEPRRQNDGCESQVCTSIAVQIPPFPRTQRGTLTSCSQPTGRAMEGFDAGVKEITLRLEQIRRSPTVTADPCTGRRGSSMRRPTGPVRTRAGSATDDTERSVRQPAARRHPRAHGGGAAGAVRLESDG
jgi:hypothetical protein